MATEKKTNIAIALMAHVDAGKTTLSEALLYRSGAKRTWGRVDHGDTHLDTHSLERARGITIFSKQALFSTKNLDITLVDTPGHVDFAAEAERVMPILDCAILVISGTDGVQAHTVTLWRLLEKYQVPVFLFVNKMDLPGTEKSALMKKLQTDLSDNCVAWDEDFEENAAMCDEALMETYLQTGQVSDGNIQGLVEKRKIFPCCFGSGLKLSGVDALLEAVDRFAPRPRYPGDFAAQVYKITRDAQNNRLTWIKITGGSLKVRSVVHYVNQNGEHLEEKAIGLRLYSGEKFTTVEEAFPGQTVAVTGLTATWPGLGLGAQPNASAASIEPVMTCRVVLPAGKDAAVVVPKLRLLEEEDPQLHLVCDGDRIHIQVMGRVQLEVFQSLVKQRFDMDVTLADPRIYYKETIENTVEGVGHFEPLRHYAEVHLLLEPQSRGSGLTFDTNCSTDVLDMNWQRLILSHMSEKIHKGVLIGAPITDMKITLLVGRAHLKHTEGGDFRQATYRAIRQGLMQAKSCLLEPWYRFTLTLPTPALGRAITDIRAMGGQIDTPENAGDISTLKGTVPASELGDYADTVASYTQGRGQLQIAVDGFYPCHNADAVIAKAQYDPEGDLENTPDSVFCAHGAGFTVKWHQVTEYMHLDSCIQEKKEPQIITRNIQADDKELERIMLREFGPQKTRLYTPPVNRPATETLTIRPMKQQYIIVDGYNIIFAWDELKKVAESDLDAARRKLCDELSSFAGFKKHRIVLVFDGYKKKGNLGEKTQFHNIQVVYTKENETADSYIEALVSEIGTNYNVRVATSDSLVQISSLRSGVLRQSARELYNEIQEAKQQMRQHY